MFYVKIKHKAVVFILLLMLLVVDSVFSQAEDIIVIHNGLVFTATEDGPIPNGAVVITQGRITAVGPEADLELPDDAVRIDAEGGTILPGLIDARASVLINKLPISDGEFAGINLRLYLTNTINAGVTTVRATGWDIETLPDLNEFRQALAEYGNTVPSVVIAGLLTHTEGNVFEIYPDENIGVATLEEAQQATEALIEAGADQIGYLQAIPPDRRAVNTAELRTGLSVEQQVAIVEAAHDHGLRVIAQTAFPEDAAAAVAAGVDEIISWPDGHLDQPLADELIQALVDNEVPLLTGFSVNAIRPHENDVRRFIEAGGTVVFGTFAPNSGSVNPYNEMRLMSLLSDMTPDEILVTATANAAHAVGLGDEIGSLEVGKRADILIVEGNALEDMRAIRDVLFVIKNGQIVFPAEDSS